MSLTPRQNQVVELSIQGLTNKRIARELGLSPETIKSHVRMIIKSTGLRRPQWWKLRHPKHFDPADGKNELECRIRDLIQRGGYKNRSTNPVAMLERFAGDVIELVGKRAEPMQPAECENGCPKNQVCDYCQGTAGTDKPPAEVVRELVGALREFLEAVEEPPEPNCCCHISPPCADCGEHSHLRAAFKSGKAALKSAKEHGL